MHQVHMKIVTIGELMENDGFHVNGSKNIRMQSCYIELDMEYYMKVT